MDGNRKKRSDFKPEGGYQRRLKPVDGNLPDLKIRLPKKGAAKGGTAKQATVPERNNSRAARRKQKQIWWALPISLAMAAVLMLLVSVMFVQVKGYASFLQQKGRVDRATFYPGVSLEGVDLSGMTLEQAIEEWGARDSKVRDSLDVTLTLGENQWPFTAEELGYTSDYQQVVQSAWSVGRYGTLEERYQVVGDLTRENWHRDFQVTRNVDEGVAMGKLNALAESLSTQPVDAQVEYFDETTRTFTFSGSKPGLVVEGKDLMNAVKSAAANGQKAVPISLRKVEPKNSVETLSQEYGLVASATTDGSFSTANRLTNLKVACKTLNGTRLDPGETFSFNKTIGKRTAKAGYKSAGAYENGITTAQLGGGICQISTTLFNAAVKSDMKITERAPHSRPSKYVGLGKDATVNWPSQDFKFQNNTDDPIFIVSYVKSKKVTVQIYGKKLPGGMKIKLSAEQNESYAPGDPQYIKDSSLAPGQQVLYEESRKGYLATTYKLYMDANDKLLKKVQLCKSYYRPAGAVYKVG